MIFHTRFGLHTLFMKYPIDVIILDKQKKVAKLKKKLVPNKFFVWKPVYPLVIELPAGSITKSKTEIGDLLEFI